MFVTLTDRVEFLGLRGRPCMHDRRFESRDRRVGEAFDNRFDFRDVSIHDVDGRYAKEFMESAMCQSALKRAATSN
jgi:hypothetical protein